MLTLKHLNSTTGEVTYIPAATVVHIPKGPGNAPVVYFDRPPGCDVAGDRRIGFTRGMVTVFNHAGAEIAEHILDAAPHPK